MWFGEPNPLPKEVLLSDWARGDKQGTKGDRVEHLDTLALAVTAEVIPIEDYCCHVLRDTKCYRIQFIWYTWYHVVLPHDVFITPGTVWYFYTTYLSDVTL